ncbi:unnamed protein product, partial [Polarella glacialis]
MNISSSLHELCWCLPSVCSWEEGIAHSEFLMQHHYNSPEPVPSVTDMAVLPDDWGLDFVIAGFAKCGTTQLVEALRQHPEVSISRHEHRFLDNAAYVKMQDEVAAQLACAKLAARFGRLDGIGEQLSSEAGGGPAVSFEISVTSSGGSRQLAERVAMLCFDKLKDGEAKAKVESFRAVLHGHCKAVGGKDVPDDSEAWKKCRVTLKHSSPLCSFTFQPDGKGAPTQFQTTVGAVGGNVIEAERIARICYTKFESGASKEQVLDLRSSLYAKAMENAAKRQKVLLKGK